VTYDHVPISLGAILTFHVSPPSQKPGITIVLFEGAVKVAVNVTSVYSLQKPGITIVLFEGAVKVAVNVTSVYSLL
jgi:hypothetical protein